MVSTCGLSRPSLTRNLKLYKFGVAQAQSDLWNRSLIYVRLNFGQNRADKKFEEFEMSLDIQLDASLMKKSIKIDGKQRHVKFAEI